MIINPKNKSVDIEGRDINFILPPYVRNYQFMNKNELPDKVIFPMFPSVNVPGADGKVHSIPIDYIAPDSPEAVEIAEDGADLTEVTPAQEAVLDEKEEEIKRLRAEVKNLSTSIIEQKGTTLTEEEVAKLTQTGRGGEDEVGGTTSTAPEYSPEDLIRQQEETIQQLEDDTADKQLEVDTTPEVSPAKAAFSETTPEMKKIMESGKSPFPERQPKQPPGGDIGTGQPLSGMHPRDARDQTMTAKALQPEADISGAEEKPFEKEIKRDENGNPIVEDKPDEQ